jgi:hypothetical protein
MMSRNSIPVAAALLLGCGASDDPAQPDPSLTGSVEITVSTELLPGDAEYDPDGYRVRVGDIVSPLSGPDETVVVDGIAPGTRAVELIDVALHCAAADGRAQVVTVSPGDRIPVTFVVRCRTPLRGRIAFSRGPNKATYGGDFQIYLADADGSNAVRLSSGEGSDDHPTWSPDGERIAFRRTIITGRSEIFVMAADGSGVTTSRITPRTIGFRPGLLLESDWRSSATGMATTRSTS